MSWDIILFWLGILSLGAQAVRAGMARLPALALWFGSAAALLVLVHSVITPHPALLAVLLWGGLILVPLALGWLIQQAQARGDVAASVRLLHLRRLFMPTEPAGIMPRAHRAALAADRGDWATVDALLTPTPDDDPQARRALATERAFLKADFEAVLGQQQAGEPGVPGRLTNAMAVVQALAETGRVAEAARLQLALMDQLPGQTVLKWLSLVRIASMLGIEPIVDEALAGPLRRQPDDVRQFLRATARRAAGGPREPYLEAMTHLQDRAASHILRQRARRRLRAPILEPAPPLDPETLALVARLHARARGQPDPQQTPPVAANDAQPASAAPPGGTKGRLAKSAPLAQATPGVQTAYAAPPPPIPNRLLAIPLLIAANTVVFLTALITGTYDNPDVLNQEMPSLVAATETTTARLRDLGMLTYPTVLLTGEYWRLVSASFLHINTLHFLLNMVGFMVLGGTVERRIGGARTLAVVVVAGVGAMAFGLAQTHYVTALSDLLIDPDNPPAQLRSLLRMWDLGVDAPLGALPPQVLTRLPPIDFLGASGGVMGLIGAMIPLAVMDLTEGRRKLARQQLTFIAIILGIQTLFDLTYLEGSSPLHLSGALIGLAVAAVLVRGRALRLAPRAGLLAAAMAAGTLLMFGPRL